MDKIEYSELEITVMSLMARGKTRGQIALIMNVSPSTVARNARSATDKAVPTADGNAPIIYGVAVMVAQGRIGVRFGEEKPTARETAVAFLEKKIMSCLDWREFEELRNAYTALLAGLGVVTDGEPRG